MLGLASRWGVKGLDEYTAQLARDFLAAASDEKKPEAARIDAARQLIDLRKTDPKAARDVIALVTPKTPPELASGLIAAVARSDSPEVGPAIVDAMGPMTPAASKASALVLLGKTEWTNALVSGIEAGKVPMSLLSLSQTQALAAHPDKTIAERAKALLAKGGGLPDPDREKVIQALAPIVLKGGDASRGKEIFKRECAKCHMHSGEGGKVGPDLTGMAAHPKSELLVHILDPSRSVEGNFLQYTVSTTDGRILNGLLASETKTSIDLLDAEGKKQTILREDIDELASSKKSLMPEGFEKSIPPEGLADLLQFLAQKGKYLPLDLRKVATVTTTRGMVSDSAAGQPARLIFEDWGPKVVDGVPFALVDPQGDRVPNAVMLYGPIGTIPPKMPRSVSLPVNSTARAIHFLERRVRLRIPGRPRGDRLDDRPHQVRGRLDGGSRAEERRAFRRLQRHEGRPGLEAGVQARRATGPLPDRRPQEEGNHRQHRAGQRERPLRPDRPGGDGRRLRVIAQARPHARALRDGARAALAMRRRSFSDRIRLIPKRGSGVMMRCPDGVAITPIREVPR